MASTSVPNSGPGWKPLLVCPQGEIARRLGAALRELAPEAVTVAEYPRLGTIAAIAGQQGRNICFLDVASNPEHAQALIAELAPAMPVVALHHRNDAELILRCLRQGACEYLVDASAATLREVFDRLERVRSGTAPRVSGTVYCVTPGKPGSGASTLAAHLAVAIRRQGTSPVLLVDADDLTGSIAFQWKLKPEFHLGDVLRDWKRMDSDLWARLTVPAFGVEVLPAPDNATTRVEVSHPVAAELCAFWRRQYRAVVLDLGDARAAVDCGFAALADVVLLVCTGDLAALNATRRALQYLEQGGCGRERLRLILDRHNSATGLQHDEVRQALSMEPFATLPNDYEALQAVLLEGSTAPAGSRYANAIGALCRKLAPPSAAVSAHKKAPWYSTLFGGK